MASWNGGESSNLIVGAIDFGTTFSGWAYLFYHDFKVDPTKGYVKQWHSGSGTLTTEKTPTVALIKPDGKTLEAFGYEAENRYRDLTDLGEHRDYYYFRHFKMMLHKQLSEKINRDAMLDDEMGKPLPAIEVFATCIQFLVNDMHETARFRVSGTIERSDVQWVLTVPAIWTDPAKQFMREAAEKAGIEREKLSIALEPEAASIYCKQLPVDKRVGHTADSISSLPVGARYMIFDAGGGTIDITVHEVNDSGGVKEVTAASGGGWGGTLVDRAFEDLLNDLVGRKVYRKFKQEQTEDWLELMREFEVKKKTVHPEKEGRILIKFPNSLSQMSEQKNGKDLKEFISDSAEYCDEVEFINDKMKFTTNIFKMLFDKSVRKTIQHVRTLLKDNPIENLKAILMVGGYSESKMLQEAIIKAFTSLEIIIPNESSSAILRGALICGHRSELISERVLKYTYGVGCVKDFIKGVHPESKRMHTDAGMVCTNIFSKHVEAGQVVEVGKAQVKKSYMPRSAEKNFSYLFVYASKMKNPEYTDTDCTCVGSMRVETGAGRLDKLTDVSLTFSGTEIKVEAVIRKTGQKTDAVLNFLG